MRTILHYQLALWLTPAISLKHYYAICQNLPNIQELFETKAEQLTALNLKAETIASLKNPDWKTIEKQLAWSQEKNHFLLVHNDQNYPTLLKQIADPPPFLFIDGDIQTLQQKIIAIVGSRHATFSGRECAFELARDLSQAGCVIISGLALGIDAASHKGALVQGKTLAVLGTGIDRIYPHSHRKLAEQIREQGALISEFPLGTSPYASNFPQRNRIISGLSLGVIIVEAAMKSGSLITAKYALEQGREVFAVPGAVNNPLAQGCHHLLKQGAILAENARDILIELNLSPPKPTPVSNQTRLEKSLEKLLQAIDYNPTPLEIIGLRTHIPSAELAESLLTLELRQYIRNESGNYIRVKNP